MRRLLLLRHGKAASPDGLADRERPLTDGGREAAAALGAFLAKEELVPDLALVSPARRTRDTWTLIKDALGDAPMRAEERLYEAPESRLFAVIGEVNPDIATLLMLGHNPGLQNLLGVLVSAADRRAYAQAIDKYPPAGLAVVALPAVTWRDVSPRSGQLDRFVTPKSLGVDDD